MEQAIIINLDPRIGVVCQGYIQQSQGTERLHLGSATIDCTSQICGNKDMMSHSFFNFSNITLHELFIEQAHQKPDQIALVDKDVALTYRELDEQSNRLANYLNRYQIQENDAVGILLEKSYEYIIACLAILKAGGAYLHLELAYPSNFLRQIFADASPKVVITKQKYQHKMAMHNVSSLYIDADNWLAADNTICKTNVSHRSVAIIGYSSGTTGIPKGVPVSHRATIYAYYKFWQEVWDIEEKDRFGYTTFITWDALSPLIMGQTGIIVPDEISFDPRRLLDFISHHKINHTFLTPSLLLSITQNIDVETLREKLEGLHIVWVGGEVTTQSLVDQTLRLMPHLYLINNYGPTECFVITQGRLLANDPATPTICSVGNVLDGMEVMIVDESMQSVEKGEVGELYATGPCLAEGYLNKPELTKEKFVSINNQIFYKTGDSARYLEDGRLIILGRRDAMVKIRSYNVNLLAIEEVFRQNSQVSECIVMAYGAEGEDKYLVAYLVRHDSATWEIDPHNLTCSEMVSYLRDYLPFYMIPHVYIELKALPIHLISGKLDKSALPLPSYKKGVMKEVVRIEGNALDLPIARQEEITIALLEEILPQQEIKKNENFFDLGLHSLLAAQLATRIKEVFSRELSVVKIYEHSSAQKLTAYLNYSHNSTEIDWQQDIILEDQISGSSRSTIFSSDSEAVFLTGATGFLGIFLLAELLRLSPTIKVYCLVRSSDRLPKLIQKMKQYELWYGECDQRIVPLIGDLEQAYFGWSPDIFEQYAESVEAIFHAGAWVNMLYPYSKLKASNVDGTREIIRFAACKVNKPLHYISTLGIFPAGTPSLYPEDDKIGSLIDELSIGYSQSKWVGEKLVWQALERKIPAQIYRIGNIGPDNRTYLANEKDTVMMLLDACKKLNMAPSRDDWFFEYTPVNFVARAIVKTALCEKQQSDVYHIASQNLVAANKVFAAMERQGMIQQVVAMDVWLQHLRDLAESCSNYDLLEHSLQVEEKFLLEQEPFDTSLFVAQMQHCQLPQPIVDDSYFIQSVYPTIQ